jgi:hypothetical protein
MGYRSKELPMTGKKKVAEPPYPPNSSRVFDVYRNLLLLQDWVMSKQELFNKYAEATGLDPSIRVKEADRFFWCSPEQFESKSVVHIHDVLLSMQRIREGYDEFRRSFGDAVVVADAKDAAVDWYFGLLTNAVALLSVANLDSEVKEAVYHKQVVQILTFLGTDGYSADAVCCTSLAERDRMLSYVFATNR